MSAPSPLISDAALPSRRRFLQYAAVVAAAHTEMVTLGTVALQLGRKIRWDATAMRVPGEPAADALLRPTYRPGFTIG